MRLTRLKNNMCEIKITPELIVALSALVVAIMSFLHAKCSSDENHKQIEELKSGQKKLYDAYTEHIDEEKKEKEEREKSMAESWEKSRKEMNEFFRREQERYRI